MARDPRAYVLRRRRHRRRSGRLDGGVAAGPRRPSRAGARARAFPALPHRRVAALGDAADPAARRRPARHRGRRLHPQARRHVRLGLQRRAVELLVPRGSRRLHARVPRRARGVRRDPAAPRRSATAPRCARAPPSSASTATDPSSVTPASTTAARSASTPRTSSTRAARTPCSAGAAPARVQSRSSRTWRSGATSRTPARMDAPHRDNILSAAHAEAGAGTSRSTTAR